MTQNSCKIAITGAIGSGKSTVAEIIASEGLPVFSCDAIYAELLNDKNFVLAIGRVFEGVVEDGILNRQKLSGIVFSDNKKLQKLNSITHPEIMSAALKKLSGYKVGFLEVPLLFENGYEKLFDKVIVVLRDRLSSIKSVTERDGLSAADVKKRLNSQFDYSKIEFAKYYVINNDSNLADLESKVYNLLKELGLK